MLKRIPVFSIFCVLAVLSYLAAYVHAISPYWFNAEWVTDDALQQVYPFHKIAHPDVFAGDLITEVMEGYLAPLHYWISYGITLLTGDPIMMSHWVMLIQLSLALVFFFLLAWRLTALAPACLALLWLVHTRTFMQRITGGIPRGWAPAILCAFLYFLCRKNHKAILVIILAGCLLNPPATMIVGVTYGAYLLLTLKEHRKEFITLLILSPLYALITFQIVKRPEHIGQMVTYEQALQMPSMQRPDGRFPFTPLLSVQTEMSMYAFQPFRHRLVTASDFIKEHAVSVYRFFRSSAVVIFLSLISIFFVISWLRRKQSVPPQLAVYFLSILVVYFLSRQFAFNLYVPDRHLQQPLTIAWILLVVTLVWKTFKKPAFIFLGIAVLVFLCNGHGFYGSSNFNYSLTKKGKVFIWLNKYTDSKALVAGHPQHIDGTMLFAKRKAYATYETAHPFYPKYFKEMLRRHEISLKAHYASELQEVYDLLAPEGVDYFVFHRKGFYPEQLEEADYFEPLNALMKKLTSRHYTDYAYKAIPRAVDLEKAPYLMYRDDQSVIIDVNKLGEYLNA